VDTKEQSLEVKVLLRPDESILQPKLNRLTADRPFLPPFGTWYAAMLFAVVPLRNFLPDSPPTGAWIDQTMVIWVLLGLAVAMVIYIVAWYRDRAG
jgi:hypothetical protein